MKKAAITVVTIVIVIFLLYGLVKLIPINDRPLIDSRIKTIPTQTAPVVLDTAYPYTLDRVVDGDTISATDASGTVVKVRIIGINSPETVDPRRPVECFGREASSHLKNDLLPTGMHLRLVSDDTQDNVDRYGRLLRYVEISVAGTTTDVGLAMIRDGFAYQYLYKHAYA